MDTTKKHARIAGIMYLLLGITAPFALLYVPSQLIVSGDAAATANLIRASESLLRAGVGVELFHQALQVFLVLALWRLFKPVNELLAWHLVCLGALVSVPIMFLNVVNEIAALTLVQRPEFLAVFSQQQLDGLAYLFLRLHGQGVSVASVFWGLWLFPFGILVIRSGFIPKFIGVLLIIAGSGYVAGAFATLVMPQIRPVVDPVTLALSIGELPIIFWLLIWGAREKKSEAVAA